MQGFKDIAYIVFWEKRNTLLATRNTDLHKMLNPCPTSAAKGMETGLKQRVPACSEVSKLPD